MTSSRTTRSVELKFWVMPNAGFLTRQILEQEIRHFEKTHPRVSVRITIHPWSHAWNRLMAVVKKREWADIPDIVQIGTSWTTTLAGLGALLDLTPRAGEIDREDVLRPLWSYCYEPNHNRLFSIPWFTDVRVLYYRRDILRSLGIPLTDIQTWDGLRTACRAIKTHRQWKDRCWPLTLSGQREQILIHDLAPWIWGAGGDFLSPDRKQAIFNQIKARRGIDYLYKMIQEGCVPLLGRERCASGNFFEGSSAFQMSGAFPLTTVLKKGHPDSHPEVTKHWGLTEFPEGPERRTTFIGGSALGITAFSNHVEEAWKLIRFLSSSESQNRHAGQIGMIPSRYSSLSDFLERKQIPREAAEVFRRAIRNARPLPSAATLGTLEQVIHQMTGTLLESVRQGQYSEKSLENVLNESAEEINSILSLYE